MTDHLLEQETHTRRRRTRLAALVVALVVLAVGAGAWVGLAYLFRSQVQVSLGEPTCRDSKVVDAELEDQSVQAIVLGEKMRCRVTLVIGNNSPRTLALRTVRISGMGPQGGAGVEVRKLEGRESTEEVEDGTDASFTTSISVDPDSERRIPVIFQFRETGCTAPELLAIPGPILRAASLGLAGDIEAPGQFYFQGTKASSC